MTTMMSLSKASKEGHAVPRNEVERAGEGENKEVAGQ